MHIWRVKRHGDPSVTRRRGPPYGIERKSTLLATLKPSMRDLAWAAGFIEGEGSFDKASGSNRISAVQVNREPIDKLLSLFGGAAKLYRKQNPIWVWYVSGARARGMMLTLYPLMTAKRQGQIRKALT